MQLYDVEEPAGRDLGLELASRSPLVTHGLLVCTNDALAPAIRPYAAPARVVAHVLSASFSDARIGIQISEETHVFDDGQASALDLLSTLLDTPQAVVVVEGPSGGGRATAIAHAVGDRVAVLDVDGLKGPLRCAPRAPA